MPEPVIVEDVCVGCGAKTLRTKFSAKSCEICGRTTARRCGTEDQFHDDVKTAVLKIKERGYAFFRNKQIYRELKRMGYQDSDIKPHDVSSAMRYHWHEISGLCHIRGPNGYYTWSDSNVPKESTT